MTYFAPVSSYKRKDSPDIEYRIKQEIAKQDFTNRIDKRVIKLDLPRGLYGFTYLGHGEMYINNDISEEDTFKTEVHEAIHTEWEYETRLLEEWMTAIDLSKIRKEIEKYSVDYLHGSNEYYRNAA